MSDLVLITIVLVTLGSAIIVLTICFVERLGSHEQRLTDIEEELHDHK